MNGGQMRRGAAALLLCTAALLPCAGTSRAEAALLAIPISTPKPQASAAPELFVDGDAWKQRFSEYWSEVYTEPFSFTEADSLAYWPGAYGFVHGLLRNMVSVSVYQPYDAKDSYFIEVGLNHSALPENAQEAYEEGFYAAVRCAIRASVGDRDIDYITSSLSGAFTALSAKAPPTQDDGREMFEQLRVYSFGGLYVDAAIDWDRSAAWFCVLTIDR